MRLATAVFYRALALAGLGQDEEAVWSWHVARSLHPPMRELDLMTYGVAGAALERVTMTERDTLGLGELEREPITPLAENVERPQRLAGSNPQYPKAVLAGCIEGRVVIEVVIDKYGRVRRPTILEGSSSELVLAFSALESVRGWRFAPATRGGEPVNVFYQLTVDFHVRGC